MRFLAAVLAAALFACGFPHVARAADRCEPSPPKLAGDPHITLPESAKPTAKFVAFEIDVGADGHPRAIQLMRGSGDGAVDLAVKQSLENASYEPARTGCVAYSAAFGESIALAPTDDPVIRIPDVAKRDSSCTPYITSFISPVARDRKKTGTATLGVPLDAAGTRSGAPILQQSTGSPTLDQEAIRIASTAHYEFIRDSACMPQAFTYTLELKFE